jgi:hypothetical protein
MNLVAELRSTLRGLGRAPAFSLTASLSLAVGMAALVTATSIVNARLLSWRSGARSGRSIATCRCSAPRR